jgi:hypothetical protein
MTASTLELIIAKLRVDGPSGTHDTIQQIRDIDWRRVSDDDIDACSEIIVLINATVIFWAFEKSGKKRNDIYVLMVQIFDKISDSDIRLRSPEFDKYVEKFGSYLNEFSPQSRGD